MGLTLVVTILDISLLISYALAHNRWQHMDESWNHTKLLGHHPALRYRWRGEESESAWKRWRLISLLLRVAALTSVATSVALGVKTLFGNSVLMQTSIAGIAVWSCSALVHRFWGEKNFFSGRRIWATEALEDLVVITPSSLLVIRAVQDGAFLTSTIVFFPICVVLLAGLCTAVKSIYLERLYADLLKRS